MTKKLNLIWETYNDHLQSMLNDMRSSNELTDVTLVSEDREQFKAHRVVLHASSPVFKSMNSNTSLSSTYIYMRGIQSYEIEPILQFIYLGQAKVSKDRLKEFLRVAKSLELKELSNDIGNSDVIEKEKIEETYKESEASKSPLLKESETDINNESKKVEFDEREELDPAIDLSTSDMLTGPVSTTDINDHQQKESNHPFLCAQCDLLYNDKTSLKRHMMAIHEGVKYPCDQCSYKAKHKHNLKDHKENVHDGIKISCDQCSRKFSKNNLQKHINYAHKGIRYSCNQCTYEARNPSLLNSHIKGVHEGFTYKCEECNYKCGWPNMLKQHVRSAHPKDKEK